MRRLKIKEKNVRKDVEKVKTEFYKKIYRII